MRWFDRQLQDRPFIAGERYTIADICALTTLDFADYIGLKTPETQTALTAWLERVSARPSASA
jgi:glutathione S-transferase